MTHRYSSIPAVTRIRVLRRHGHRPTSPDAQALHRRAQAATYDYNTTSPSSPFPLRVSALETTRPWLDLTARTCHFGQSAQHSQLENKQDSPSARSSTRPQPDALGCTCGTVSGVDPVRTTSQASHPRDS